MRNLGKECATVMRLRSPILYEISMPTEDTGGKPDSPQSSGKELEADEQNVTAYHSILIRMDSL